jgi:histidyl-tRNA synthetase
MRFQALPGFRDFYPEEMALRRHIEAAWHRAARGAGFEEIDGPPLESLELLKAKSGDAIVEEIYHFVDKGGREVALRAELTPTLGRMIGSKANALRKPVKWYAVPQLFRYERQQRGRLREHIQWNCDILGAPETAAEAEAISVALDALRSLGLTEKEVYVRVNDRRLAEERLRALGATDVPKALAAVDRGQTEDPAVRAYLEEPFRPDAAFESFLAACEDLGIRGFIEPDKRIVRGLAYYTGFVFEIFDRGRTLRAVAGGGRYDHLIESLGGPAMPALGFGMGDVVLGELLRERGLLPPKPPRIDAFVVPIGDGMVSPARRVVRMLRDAGVAAETPYAPLKMNKALQIAGQIGAPRVVLVGPDEWARGEVVVREQGAQRSVPLDRLR